MYKIEYLTNIDDFINHSTTPEKRKIVKNLRYLQEYGIRAEVIDIKKLSGYVFWEVRILGKSNIRIFCMQKGKTVYILHVFKKKTNKTSRRDLEFGQKQAMSLDKYI